MSLIPIRTVIYRVTATCLAIAVLLFIPAATQAQSQTPTEVVEIFHDALAAAWRDAAALGYDGKREILEPAVATTFDTATMIRVATGRHNWEKFSEQQRKKLLDCFTAMTIAAYAGRFKDYSGQYFESLGEEPGKRKRVLVRTRLVRSNGEEVGFNYLMRPDGDSWAILDIYLDGKFSELAVWRSEFSAVLRDRGYDGLIAAIEERITKYREG